MPEVSAVSAQLSTVLNAPDLILLAILLLSAFFGARQGLIHTLFSCFGRLAALAGAVYGAKLLAPVMARFLVTPIVGQVFQKQAASLYEAFPETAASIETAATNAAVSMAEGLAYLILLIVLMISLTLLVGLIGSTLDLISKFGPISLLNRIGGLAVGLVFGVLLCFLLLWALQAFAPTVLSELGWLSPARVSETLLTQKLLHFVPGYGGGNPAELLAGFALR